MSRNSIALTLGLLIGPTLASGAMAQGTAPAITEAEAHAIAVDAYVYFYPLVMMDVTRRQFTNVEPGKELGKGPMNTFNNVPEYPPADFKGVVRPNFDTPSRIPAAAIISCRCSTCGRMYSPRRAGARLEPRPGISS
jgi:hypothetical protein